MRQIRNMRELELKEQNLNYKILHLEDKIVGHSEEMLNTVTGKLREVVFETGMKMMLNLLFKKKKKKHRKRDKSEIKN